MYLPAVNHEEFPYQLSQVDVLLIPLRNTPYNNSQPDTILMQAGAKGIPWAASSIPSFQHRQRGGVICESLDEWHLNIRHLVVDEELRRRLGREGRINAETREMNLVGKLWLDVINQAAHPAMELASTLESSVVEC
jgi:hypothetical protein